MNNQRNLVIILVAVALISLVFFLWSGNSDGSKYKWTENYKAKSKHPYGIFIVREMLSNHFSDYEFTTIKKKLKDKLPTKTDEPANYVFIGDNYFIDTASMQALMDFAFIGNQVFISSNRIPNDLVTLYFDECQYYWNGYKSFYDTVAYVNHNHEQLRTNKGFEFKYVRKNKTREYSWNYIENNHFCKDVPEFLSIGTIGDSLSNFVRIPYGEGTVFLHTTPIAFSNYHQITENGRDYAEKVFAHLQEGDIYWDVHSQIMNYEDDYNRLFSPVKLSRKSPLSYILSDRSLTWAWYTLLGVIALYLIFRTKRRQKIIPVIEPNTNTSLEFIETIGRLYFQQNNHKKLSEQKMKLFLGFIRERYHFSTQEINDKMVQKLSRISEINQSKVEVIFKRYNSILKNDKVTEHQLIQFHLAIDHFYKNCK